MAKSKSFYIAGGDHDADKGLRYFGELVGESIPTFNSLSELTSAVTDITPFGVFKVTVEYVEPDTYAN